MQATESGVELCLVSEKIVRASETTL